MKIVFLSNYYNHHQAPFCHEIINHQNIEFYFIATEPISKERISLGYSDMNRSESFIIRAYENKNEEDRARLLILNCDLLFVGSAPEFLYKKRLISGKLVFNYSERMYKNGFQWWKWPFRLIRHYYLYGQYHNTYMLCASAYTAYDCAITGLYKNKTYKWGYFPKVDNYDLDILLDSKDPCSILWVGRLIDWKHPEVPVLIAKKLLAEGYSFSMNIIGNGLLFDNIKAIISENKLDNYIHLLGSMSPDQVRDYMKKSDIFLATSDFKEGWGAVINESMNSACAVVASHAMGAVPYLINDGKNGLIYKSGCFDDCYTKVTYLLNNPTKRRTIGKLAYNTMNEMWNAKIAADRLIKLADAVLNGNRSPSLFLDGPCSRAELLKNDYICK